MKVTRADVEAKYKTLPSDIQAAITSDFVSDNLERIGQKYKLRVDKIGDMIDEVGLVMLGFKKSSDFIGSLSKRLKIDRETAEAMAVDIDNEVFKKIRESLRQVQFGENRDEQAPASQTDSGDSPARDSLLQEIEMHGNEQMPAGVVGAASTADYSETDFADPNPTPQPTPYQQTISEEEKHDPNKTFKDHLEKKMEAAKPVVNADPYRESID